MQSLFTAHNVNIYYLVKIKGVLQLHEYIMPMFYEEPNDLQVKCLQVANLVRDHVSRALDSLSEWIHICLISGTETIPFSRILS